jgi:IclR family KDG regulon transcriptional repressor
VLNTILRTGDVLDLFTAERPEWGVTEVAGALGVGKSNAHEVLASLAEIGLVQRTRSARYRLGWRLLAMSRDLLTGVDVQRRVRPLMTELARHLGESVHLAAWDGRRAVYVSRVIGSRGIRLDEAHPGSRVPGHCTAVGKVLLADQPWCAVLKSVGKDGLSRRTPRTVKDLGLLEEELDRVRLRGVAHDWEELVDGVGCVAAGITDRSGSVVAAMSVAAPTERLLRHEQAYTRGVLGACRRLSRPPTENFSVACTG